MLINPICCHYMPHYIQYYFYFYQLNHHDPEGSDDLAKELLAQKCKKSHKYLSNVIYLLEQVKHSVVYLNEETHKKKLLCYLCRLYEAMSCFTEVFFNHKPLANLDKFSSNVVGEIQKATDQNQDLLRLTKIKIHVLLVKNSKAQEIIETVLSKVQTKLQRYLVHIDYFNKRMYDFCRVE